MNTTDHTAAVDRAALAYHGAQVALDDAIRHDDIAGQLEARQRLVEAAHELAQVRQEATP